MKVIIVNDTDINPIGYNLVPETDEERQTLATVRNLVFFGMDEEHVEYAGLECIDPKIGKAKASNIDKLKFRQQKHIDQ